MEFQRGVDIKLGDDSYVIVAIKGSTTLSLSEVRQAIGRSSRRNGQSRGACISNYNNVLENADIKMSLEGNEEGKNRDGFQLLRYLFDKFEGLQPQ